MRTNSIVLILAGSLVAVGAVFVASQSGRERGVDAPQATSEPGTDAAPAIPGASSSDEDESVRAPVEATANEAGGERPTPEDPYGVYMTELLGIDPSTVQFWHECMEEPNADAMRNCIQIALAGRDIPPAELAEMVCGEVPPDSADRFLIEEVAALWPPEEMTSRIRAFRAVCNEPGTVWAGFLQVQAERDPVWLEAFAQTLTPEDIFDGEGMAMLFVADALLDMGDEDVRAMLAAGALGQFGGSDAQVTFAIQKSFDNEKDPEKRFEFLRSIATSPNFAGRPKEVEALVECALQGSGDEASSGSHLAFLSELFEDPLFAPGASKRILELYQWNRLPSWLSESDRRALVALARDAAGS